MMREFYGRLVDLLDKHHTLAIATVVDTSGSTPREHGAKMVVLPNGTTHGTIGGGGLEKLVTEEALEALKEGQGFFREYDLVEKEEGGIGSKCGGKTAILVEVLTAPDTLLVCGGGHIGHALARLAVEVGFQVIIVDPREKFAEPGRFPKGVQVMNLSPTSDKVRDLVTGNTYVVILTHDHVLDKEALKNILGKDASYNGMIGSKRKVKKVFEELVEEGLDKEVLGTVHAPIGLDIAAETPAEIAISILGEMIHIKRKGMTSGLSMKVEKD
jgi:xanthine dehydrogenase accessory factor